MTRTIFSNVIRRGKKAAEDATNVNYNPNDSRRKTEQEKLEKIRRLEKIKRRQFEQRNFVVDEFQEIKFQQKVNLPKLSFKLNKVVLNKIKIKKKESDFNLFEIIKKKKWLDFEFSIKVK